MKQTKEDMERNQDWIIANLTERRIKRFWSKVGAPDERECMNWIPSDLTRNGYGRFPMTPKRPSAHRITWILKRGRIPEGLWVLHKCDNPRCCNIDHLFLGTSNDNVQDMVSKGRHSHGDVHPFRVNGAKHMVGSKSHKAKLKEQDVIRIRQDYVSRDVTCLDLSKEWNVSESLIAQIIRRDIWTHI